MFCVLYFNYNIRAALILHVQSCCPLPTNINGTQLFIFQPSADSCQPQLSTACAVFNTSLVLDSLETFDFLQLLSIFTQELGSATY